MYRPKLRRVERIHVARGEEDVVVLQDPLAVADSFALSACHEPVLDLLDGGHTLAQVHQSLRFRNVDVERDDLRTFVTALSTTGWLDDDAFRERWKQEHDRFIEARVRLPAHAGVVYPSDPDSLRCVLPPANPSSSSLPNRNANPVPGTLFGLVSPYQAFDRATETYAAVLSALPQPGELDVIVVLAADHGPGKLPFSLTNKTFRTPLGDVVADERLCDRLARRCQWLRREEIRHRRALGPEMAAVLLAHAYGSACPPIVPLLCGKNAWPHDAAAETDEFFAAAEILLSGSRVLYLAMTELSHVGPAFGHTDWQPEQIDATRSADESLLSALEGPIAPYRLARELDARGPRGRLSGASTLAALVQLLPVSAVGCCRRYDLVSVSDTVTGWSGVSSVEFRHDPRPAGR